MSTSWTPDKEWDEEDAYVVGGGPSLRNFDWSLLHGKNAIGCNSAYILGAAVVPIVVFGDHEWWDKIGHEGTARYGGRVVGAVRYKLRPCPWLLTMERQEFGLGTSWLGWNGNSGSLAVNLALILGARRVFLLGFDMRLGGEGRANWHDLRYQSVGGDVYGRFIQGFGRVAKALPQVFPRRSVVNLTDSSDLPHFEKVSLAVHFGRPVERREEVLT